MITFSIAYWQYYVLTWGILACIILCFRNTGQLIKGWKFPFFGLLIMLLGWYYIGTRPIDKVGDSELYSTIYNLVAFNKWTDFKSTPSEWFWSSVEWSCLRAGITASGWFMVVAAFYFIGHAIAISRWLPRNFTFGVIFVVSAISFGAYSYNGLRQGMAAALCLAGLSLLPVEDKRNIKMLIIGGLLLFCGASSHTSMIMFGLCAAVAYFCPGMRKAYVVWGVCLLLSPIATSFSTQLGALFISVGRFSTYSALEATTAYANLGWRWDFIIYSALPVLVAWYITERRRIEDKTYMLIASTYLYANAGWLLVNSIAYSNRFAYISWCLYPFVLCYPLLRMRLCKKQGVLTAGTLALMLLLYMILS